MKLKLFEFPIDPRYKDSVGNVTNYVLARGDIGEKPDAFYEACHYLEKDCHEYYELILPDKEIDITIGKGKEIYDRMIANRWQIMKVNHDTDRITYWHAYHQELWNDVDDVPPMKTHAEKNAEFDAWEKEYHGSEEEIEIQVDAEQDALIAISESTIDEAFNVGRIKHFDEKSWNEMEKQVREIAPDLTAEQIESLVDRIGKSFGFSLIS